MIPRIYYFLCVYLLAVNAFSSNRHARSARGGRHEAQNLPHRRKRKPTNKDASSSMNPSIPDIQSQLDYERNGHCVIRKCISSKHNLESLRKQILVLANEKELSAWKQKVQVASNDPAVAQKCKTVKECQKILKSFLGEDVDLPFLQYFNMWREIPDLETLARDLAKTAGKLMDVDSVRLYQDALFWKRSGDGATPWHVDARMAPFDSSNLVTFWIPLQSIPKEGTGLLFCSKSHKDFALPYWNSLDDSAKEQSSPWNDLETRYSSNPVDYMPLQVGDVTVHNGWTLHCSNPNDATKDRLALAISYVDGRAPVRANALDDQVTDNEDVWSYEGWVREVPARKLSFRHASVPILWKR